MALIDRLLQFSDKQTIAAGASTNTLDTKFKTVGTASLPICLQGQTVAPSAATVTVTVEHSDDNSTFVPAATSKAFKAAELNKGAFFYANSATKRYVRLSYAVSGTPTGTITAWLGNEADIKVDYKATVGAGQPV